MKGGTFGGVSKKVNGIKDVIVTRIGRGLARLLLESRPVPIAGQRHETIERNQRLDTADNTSSCVAGPRRRGDLIPRITYSKLFADTNHTNQASTSSKITRWPVQTASVHPISQIDPTHLRSGETRFICPRNGTTPRQEHDEATMRDRCYTPPSHHPSDHDR
jgi:hypothetical protein